jgi:hypothetical protein
MSIVDLGDARWFRSSYSAGGENRNCVEVAFVGLSVAVGDSKSPADGTLAVSRWARASLVTFARTR